MILYNLSALPLHSSIPTDLFSFSNNKGQNVDDDQQGGIKIAVLPGLLNANESNCSQMFFKIGGFRNFTIFTGKQLCWSLFLIKLYTFRPEILLKIDFNAGVFLDRNLRWLLLDMRCLVNLEKKYFPLVYIGANILD